MRRVHFATIVAIIITSSIASNVLAVGTLGPAAPEFLAALRSEIRQLRRRLRSLFNHGIAAARAYRRRRAAWLELSALSDRELKDMGLYRGSIGHLRRNYPERRS